MSEEGNNTHQPNLDFETNRVYVGNLNWKTSWQDLKDFFNDQIGGVEFADVLIGYDGRSKGCGIVEFSSNEDAKKAVKELQGFDFDGREIFLREDREPNRRPNNNRRRNTRGRGRGRGGRGGRGGARIVRKPVREETGGGSGRQIYVGNLNWATTKDAVEEKYSAFGTVEKVNLETDYKGRSKGWATVLFETKESADAAVADTNGVEFEGRPLKVHVDKFFSEGTETNTSTEESGETQE